MLLSPLYRNLERQKKASNDKLHLRGSKFAWFADRLVEGRETYTYDEICDMVEAYINRDSGMIEQIKKGKRVSKHQELVLLTRLQQERDLFNSGSGFEAPDLRLDDVVQRLA